MSCAGAGTYSTAVTGGEVAPLKASPLTERRPNEAASPIQRPVQRGLRPQLQTEIDAFADKVLRIFSGAFISSIADRTTQPEDRLYPLNEEQQDPESGKKIPLYLNVTQFCKFAQTQKQKPQDTKFKKILEAIMTTSLSFLATKYRNSSSGKFIKDQNEAGNGTQGATILEGFVFRMLSHPKGGAYNEISTLLHSLEAELDIFKESPTLKSAMLHLFP